MIPLFFTLSYFNSHAHVERDEMSNDYLNELRISTHTLMWSVTFHILANSQGIANFNSHAHVERDI